MRFIKIATLLSFVLVLAACVTPIAPQPQSSTGKIEAKSETAKPIKIEPAVHPQARLAYEQAVAALKANRYADAERGFLAVTARAPDIAGPYANLGIVYYRTGRAAEAVRSLERAIELNPKAAYYNELGMVHRAEGRFDAARRAYLAAIALDPDYAYAQLNLGILYDLYLQQPEKALPYYERYRALTPSEATTIGKWIADLKRRNGSSTAEQTKGGKSG